MKVTAHQKGALFYAQIDDMFEQHEINEMQKEIVFLETLKQGPNATNAAVGNGVVLKDGHGIFVDSVYSDRNHSTILRLNRRLFLEELVEKLRSSNCFYDHILRCNADTTLLNFYGNDGNYKTHADSSVLTAVTFFKIGDFSGGNFCFPEYEVSIDPVEGRTVIFPGCVMHMAHPIVANPGNYRVTMAQFLTYSPR